MYIFWDQVPFIGFIGRGEKGYIKIYSSNGIEKCQRRLPSGIFSPPEHPAGQAFERPATEAETY
jgi:hypothetical protein